MTLCQAVPQPDWGQEIRGTVDGGDPVTPRPRDPALGPEGVPSCQFERTGPKLTGVSKQDTKRTQMKRRILRVTEEQFRSKVG